MRIIDILRRKRGKNTVVMIAPHETLERAARLMADHLVGALVVCDSKHNLFGVVAERDIVRAIAFHGPGALDLKVQHITPAEMPVCRPSDRVNQVVQRVANEGVRYLPVKDESGQLIGIVSVGDLLKVGLTEKAEDETPGAIMSPWDA
jgi:CBS domain-containing protein